MPTAIAPPIDRVQDMSDVGGTYTDGDVPQFDTAQGKFLPSASGAGSDKTYIHDQNTPSATWVIQHNLGKHPSVTVVDTAGTHYMTSVHDDLIDPLNKLTVVLSAAMSGKAYIN